MAATSFTALLARIAPGLARACCSMSLGVHYDDILAEFLLTNDAPTQAYP